MLLKKRKLDPNLNFQALPSDVIVFHIFAKYFCWIETDQWRNRNFACATKRELALSKMPGWNYSDAFHYTRRHPPDTEGYFVFWGYFKYNRNNLNKRKIYYLGIHISMKTDDFPFHGIAWKILRTLDVKNCLISKLKILFEVRYLEKLERLKLFNQSSITIKSIYPMPKLKQLNTYNIDIGDFMNNRSSKFLKDLKYVKMVLTPNRYHFNWDREICKNIKLLTFINCVQLNDLFFQTNNFHQLRKLRLESLTYRLRGLNWKPMKSLEVLIIKGCDGFNNQCFILEHTQQFIKTLKYLQISNCLRYGGPQTILDYMRKVQNFKIFYETHKNMNFTQLKDLKLGKKLGFGQGIRTWFLIRLMGFFKTHDDSNGSYNRNVSFNSMFSNDPRWVKLFPSFPLY